MYICVIYCVHTAATEQYLLITTMLKVWAKGKGFPPHSEYQINHLTGIKEVSSKKLPTLTKRKKGKRIIITMNVWNTRKLTWCWNENPRIVFLCFYFISQKHTGHESPDSGCKLFDNSKGYTKGIHRPLKRKVRKVRKEATATLRGTKSDQREENVNLWLNVLTRMKATPWSSVLLWI